MSDSDKTRDKLVSSIRKTKAGAAKREGAVDAPSKDEQQSAPQEPRAASKPDTSSKQRSAPKRDSAEREREVPYMRGTRVWPD